MSLVENLKSLHTMQKIWKEARRPVPIGSVAPRMAECYKTIPLQFVGSRHLFIQRTLDIFGILIGRKAVKSPFLCDKIEIVDRDGSRHDLDDDLHAGQRIRVQLSIGESASHAVTSAICLADGKELQLAIVNPTPDLEQYGEYATCISVRTRGRPELDETGFRSSRVIMWDVIEARDAQGKIQSRQNRHQLPNSTIQLFSREPFTGLDIDDYSDHISRIPGVGLCYAYGSTRLTGMMFLLLRSLITVLLVFLLDGIIPLSDQLALLLPNQFDVLILVLVLVLIWRIMRLAWIRSRTKPPRLTTLPSWHVVLFSGKVERFLLWHGSTKRSLSIGNKIQNTGLWNELNFTYVEPFCEWLGKWWRRTSLRNTETLRKGAIRPTRV